ncbi:GAF domain-containing protein [uncultured Desulfuromonas sp.]|uniref:GAF domain-containing protein n=1 Tax=uncultured Desulfuromonas sp. TaxID=181013 RepID=UPI002AAAC9CC|nr:GAF domain-containing protein [uncultured Desulfuromonas sp.]
MFAAAPNRLRPILIGFATLAGVAALVYITYGFGFLPQLSHLEQEVAFHHCEQVQTHVEVELDALSALAKDYTSVDASQDETNRAERSWSRHLTQEMLHHHGLDEVVVYDKRGTLLFNRSNAQRGNHDSELCRTAFNLTQLSARPAISGLLHSEQGISLVATRTVSTDHPDHGGDTVILCRRLSPQVIADWSRRLHLDIDLTDLTEITHNNPQQLRRLLQQAQEPHVTVNTTFLEANTLLFDIGKTPIALVRVKAPRQSSMASHTTSVMALLVMSLLLSAIILMTARVFSRRAQQPFSDLAIQIRNHRQHHQLEPLCEQQGTTELARQINGLLDDLNECRQSQIHTQITTNLLKQVVPCAIFTVDHRRVITSWNDRAEQLTGYQADEMIGSSCYRFALSPCHRQCGLFNQQIDKPVMDRECTIRHKNGTLLTISKNANLLRDNQGEVIGGVECFVDMTHHKRDEQALQWEVSLNSRLASLSHAIVQQHADQHEVARQLLSHARNLTGSRHGFIAAINPGGSQSLWDCTSLFEEFYGNNSATIPAAAAGRGSLLHAVYNRKTGVYFNGLERLNVAHLAGGIQKPLRHFMAVPVDDGERIVGQVALANNDEGYSVRDLQAIEQLAELFAVYLAQKPTPAQTA